MKKGILTLVNKSAESGHRTPGVATAVSFESWPTVGECFSCIGASLTPGAEFRWIRTSPVVEVDTVREPDGFNFKTKSGSTYELRDAQGK